MPLSSDYLPIILIDDMIVLNVQLFIYYLLHLERLFISFPSIALSLSLGGWEFFGNLSS